MLPRVPDFGEQLSFLMSLSAVYIRRKLPKGSDQGVSHFCLKSSSGVNSSNLSPEKVVECVNQLFAVSREQSKEKKKIADDIQKADAILQSKNVSIETINEHIRLNNFLENNGYKDTRPNTYASIK
jgi:hypothetical protein